MKNNAIFTIFKKELARFFKDRRTLIALIMPGILLYFIYSLMGSALTSNLGTDEEYIPQIVIVNTPASVDTMLADAPVVLTKTTADKVEDVQKQISNEEKDILVIFPENFDEKVIAYTPASGEPAPNVEIYYNSASTNSSNAFGFMTSLLSAFESSMTNKFDVNMSDKTYDLASEEDITGMIFSMMMPMLLVMLLFSGCMAVAPESIAGEKERGTIASLLITPTKRSHIAIGKILALSVLALISGASSTIGIVLSLPKLMGEDVALDGSVYGVADYAMLAVVILSTVLLFITLISIISAYAKNVKEAASYVTPLMIFSMVIAITGMFGISAENPALFLIPIFNSVQSMIGIFSFEPNILNMAITVGTNLVITAAGVFVLTRMFNSEKIMFNK